MSDLITEAAVIRYHYACLANIRYITSAGLVISSNEAKRRESHRSESEVSHSLSDDSTSPGDVDPALLMLGGNMEAEELATLAQAIIDESLEGVGRVGEASGSGSMSATGRVGGVEGLGGAEKKGKGKGKRKRSLLSGVDDTPELRGATTNTAEGFTSTMTRSPVDDRTHTSQPDSIASHSTHHPRTSGPLDTIHAQSLTPMPIPTSRLLAYRLASKRQKSSLPPHLSIIPTYNPLTPGSTSSSGGMEIDELSTPFQPLLYGKVIPLAQSLSLEGVTPNANGNASARTGVGGILARLGMAGARAGSALGVSGVGVGTGRQNGSGWAVGTPVPRGE